MMPTARALPARPAIGGAGGRRFAPASHTISASPAGDVSMVDVATGAILQDWLLTLE
jgi:hypothetical protein